MLPLSCSRFYKCLGRILLPTPSLNCQYVTGTNGVEFADVFSFFPSFLQDGGCSCPGDVAKAFGAGADFVMLGGMFAGHDQCAGDIIEKNGKKVKLFYGMSSDTAMKKHAGGVADYRYYSLSSIICQATS
uniref:GMP reductase n=1 Tax=Micrurus spixii TaxID=129469 RepID=A0A2D4LBC8_9SAUR